jgi:hypothetical protein
MSGKSGKGEPLHRLGPEPKAHLVHIASRSAERVLLDTHITTAWVSQPVTATRPASGNVMVDEVCGSCGTAVTLIISSVEETRKRRLRHLGISAAMLLSAVLIPFEARYMVPGDHPAAALWLVLIILEGLLALLGVVRLFSWRNDDGVRIPRQPHYLKAGHLVYSPFDLRSLQRRSTR